jgi:hypothetical protein
MTNFQFLILLQSAVKELDKLESFVSKIRLLSHQKEPVLELLRVVSAFDRNHASALSTLQNHLNSARTEISGISSRQFFEAAFALATTLRNLQSALGGITRFAGSLLDGLEHLQNAFDGYTQTHSTDRVLSVILHADDFITRLDSFHDYVDFTQRTLREDEEKQEGEGELALYMPATLTFEEFIERLKSINTIYEELCQIFGIPIGEQPLRIGKVESGSLWTCVFGNMKVIEFMIETLKGGAKYIQRNYTNEGKLAAIPSSVRLLEDMIQLKAKLASEGIDTIELEDQIAKGALLIAKGMNVLYEKQTSINIAGEEIPFIAQKTGNLLGARPAPRLQNNGAED